MMRILVCKGREESYREGKEKQRKKERVSKIFKGARGKGEDLSEPVGKK
jgi:hypothetical protein